MRAYVRCASLLIFLSAVALAQDTGQITGTVHDPSGASIANAQVTVSSPERGINRVTNTNSDGDYLVGGLPPGSYNLEVTAQGFKKFTAPGIILRIGGKNRADADLQVGAAATTIEVQGQNVAQVETQSSDLAGTVTSKQISQLQLNGRNFTQLATLVPGVSNQTGQDEGTVGVYGNVIFSVNGGRGVYNNWEIDGGDNMDNGSNATLNVYPSIDAIAEVRVLTSNYGAQYGRNGSGTVETETKSGTSSFHGDVYEFVRNDAFNARNFFQSTVPSYKKNDYGYTIGGPVFIPGVYNTNKDKTFVFWSQEWRKDRVPGQNFNVNVPSVAERQGDFSDLCPNAVTGSSADCPIDPATGLPFANNQVPVAPAATAFLQQIPEPTGGIPGAEVFQASPIQPTNWREELLRIDHNFNPNWRATFRYIHDSWDTITAVPLWTNAGDFPTVGTEFGGPGVSVVARLTANASPTLLNEFVFSYTTDHIILNSFGAWQRPAVLDQPGVMGALFQNGFGGKAPGFQLTGGSAYGGGFGEDPGYIPNGLYNSNPTYTVRDNVTKIVGRHNLIFGGYAAFRQKNELSTLDDNGFLNFDNSAPVSTGNPFADLLIGRIADYNQGSKNLKYYNRSKTFEPYLQDDWRVTDRLTLNLGLRVSLFGTYRERYHNVFNFDPRVYDPAKAPLIDVDGSVTGQEGALIPGSGDPFNGMVQCGVNGAPPGCQEGHLFNPAPRIGFAYDLSGNGRTAIRGGYGMFWEQTNGNEANTESLSGSPPGVLSPTQFNIVGYPNIGGGALLFPLNVTSIQTKFRFPYTQQWHLDLQHEVLRNTVATVSYVGSKGTHLGRRLDLNQLHALSLSDNPYKVGEPIGGVDNSHDDCGTFTTPSGVAITGDALINLQVACGADPNQFRLFRGFGNIGLLEDKSSSLYHAFQASLRRGIGGLQVNVAYTYSHSIDDSSGRFDGGFVDTYNPTLARASSNFDQRHLVNIGYVYDLPFFKAPGLAHTLLGGWQLSGITTWQTGTPFTLTNQANYSDNAGVGNGFGQGSYPDVVGDPKSNVPKVALPDFGPLVYNPGAFAAPRGLSFGTAGRNVLRNPNRTNFDMALFKHFAIREQIAFEFRAEAFNIFNHTQWANLAGDDNQAGSPNPTNSFSCYGGGSNSAGDPSCLAGNNFLHIGGAHNPRILQLGAKFVF